MNIWGYRGGAHSSIYHNHGISRSDEFGSATNPLFKPWYLQTGARQTGTHQQLNPYHIARLDNGWDLGGPLPHQLPGSDYFPPQGQVRGAVSPDTHQPQLGTGRAETSQPRIPQEYSSLHENMAAGIIAPQYPVQYSAFGNPSINDPQIPDPNQNHPRPYNTPFRPKCDRALFDEQML